LLGAFFADGHVEIRRWLSDETKVRLDGNPLARR